MSRDLMKKMGFIFQQPNLFPWLTVRQNVALPLKVFGLQGKEWEQNVVDGFRLYSYFRYDQIQFGSEICLVDGNEIR